MENYRVLVIDPDLPTTKYLTHTFQKAGIECFAANSSKEGLILAYQHRPHVIILDPAKQDIDLKELLNKFKKDWRVSRSKVIAFSSLSNPEEIQQAINLGFHLYLAKESGAVSVLIEKTIAAAEIVRNGDTALPKRTGSPEHPESERKEEPLPSSQKNGKTVIFISGKGGVGTSSLCANIAQIASKALSLDVSLVDLVLPIGSLAAIVGEANSIDIIQTAEQAAGRAMMDFLQESLPQPENWDFRFLAGSHTPEQSEKLDISRIPVIIESLKKISDYVFVDLGKSLSKISLPIIKSADQIVLTMSLDQATVDQTLAVWNYLKKQGVDKDQIYFMINRAVSLEGLNKSEVEELLGVVVSLAVPYMGRNFTLTNNLNLPISEKFPQDAVTISIRQATEEIIQKIERKANKIEFF